MTAVLLTVPDEGAADTVCEALGEAGIPATRRRSWGQHPYQPSPLATPYEVLVAPSSLEAAKQVLLRLHHESEEAFAAGAPQPFAAGSSPQELSGERDTDGAPRPRTLSYALALLVALLPVVPLACFYAGARRWGVVFSGVALAAFCLMFSQGQSRPFQTVAAPYASAWHGWLRPRDSRDVTEGERPSQRPLGSPLAATPFEDAYRSNLALGRTLTLAKLGDLAVALWMIRRQRLARR